MQQIIGTVAGNVWKYLSKHGPTTTLKLKAALGVSNSVLFLAIGWLAREDKVELVESEHTYTVSLTQVQP